MMIRAIRCTRSQFPVEETLEIDEIAGETGPVVFLTPQSNRAGFESRRDRFEWIKRDGRKGLKSYLGRQGGKIPVLVTDYGEPARLRGSVARLLGGSDEKLGVCVLAT